MVKIIGLDELKEALAKIKANLENAEIITKPLAASMREYVHIDSGDLQASIDYQGIIAYADTIYAGVEADRGGSHDYATQAVDAFDIESYADAITEPF